MSSPASPAPVHHQQPPRRAFGASSKQQQPIPPFPRPSSSSSIASSASITPQATPSISASQLFLNPPPEPQRTRSASSASTEAFESAATKAQAWLSTWAPYKGEGRGREFLSSTLNGVAGVASTVSHGINGAVNKGVQLSTDRRVSMSRPASFSGPPPSHDFAPSTPPSGSALATSPPGPTHAFSTSAVPTGRRVLQPANSARLGAGTASPPLPAEQSLRPTMSHPAPAAHRRSSSSSPLAPPTVTTPHGPSHLNPYHVRTGSTSHIRSSSFGAVPPPNMSRTSSAATGGKSATGRINGMSYKIGFQPAGVRHDRSEEFQDMRKAASEERDKEEGRLGRRWAKVSFI